MTRLVLKIIVILALVGSILWFYFRPDFESAIAVLMALAALLPLFLQGRSSANGDEQSSRARKAQEASAVKQAGTEYEIEEFDDGGKKIHIVRGELTVDTLTWGASVDLPPFKDPPDIRLSRTGFTDLDAPDLITRTENGFSVKINSSQQAGEWHWQANGVLLSKSIQK